MSPPGRRGVGATLLTRRLALRRLTQGDVDAVAALHNDPRVMRFINGGKPTDREVIANDVLPRMIAVEGDLPGFGYWAAELRDTGEFLGWFELCPPSHADPGEAELGYRLHVSAWGCGLATEGARALVRKGFTEDGLRRVTATTMTVNAASRRVMEKTGLRLVRTFFEDWPDVIEGSELGDVEYALTRAEWLALDSAERG